MSIVETSWSSSPPQSTLPSLRFRLRIDQRALGGEGADFILGKSGLAQEFPAVLAHSGRMMPDRRWRLAPCRSGTGKAQRAFRRMLDRLDKADGGEMRIVDQAVEIVQRRVRDVGFRKEFQPFR